MSSCFLCDCSYKFVERDVHSVVYKEDSLLQRFMKQLPIMVGSTGTGVDDQQHKNNNKQNYVSYRVKKLEFCCSYNGLPGNDTKDGIPDYVLIFKVPFRSPVFEYDFYLMKDFMLYSEPECVLEYNVLQTRTVGGSDGNEIHSKHPNKFNININKPFIVGPNDYVGVFYMFAYTEYLNFYVDASARVWFDLA